MLGIAGGAYIAIQRAHSQASDAAEKLKETQRHQEKQDLEELEQERELCKLEQVRHVVTSS